MRPTETTHGRSAEPSGTAADALEQQADRFTALVGAFRLGQQPAL